MTVEDLTAKLMTDGENDTRRRVRRHCTEERCRRVAERALAAPRGGSHEWIESCAEDEPPESRQKPKANVKTDGYGFAWLALLLPLIQLVLQFLASRAKHHLEGELS
jgi:hypothetical protein